jgi:hypothetical protein
MIWNNYIKFLLKGDKSSQIKGAIGIIYERLRDKHVNMQTNKAISFYVLSLLSVTNINNLEYPDEELQESEGGEQGEGVEIIEGDKEGEAIEGVETVEGDKEGETIEGGEGDKEGETIEGDKEGETIEGGEGVEGVEGRNKLKKSIRLLIEQSLKDNLNELNIEIYLKNKRMLNELKDMYEKLYSSGLLGSSENEDIFDIYISKVKEDLKNNSNATIDENIHLIALQNYKTFFRLRHEGVRPELHDPMYTVIELKDVIHPSSDNFNLTLDDFIEKKFGKDSANGTIYIK